MINTLIQDIYAKVGKKDGWFTTELSNEFAVDVALRLSGKFNEVRDRPRLRLSQMGPKCPKHLWHSIHTPELAEPLPPQAEIKYAYGHILEALAITLAKAAGHEVTGEQDELTVDGITGHRDCIIDGCIVDVKSTTSIGFQKFKDKSIGQEDSFGYLDQLDGYMVGSADDPLVRVKDRAYLLAIDKNLGHMVIYEHILREASIRKRIADYKGIISLSTPPACRCGTAQEGKSGNIKLDTKASYNPYKFCCFPLLRTFIYSKGPVYLTHVERIPDVPEITRYTETSGSIH